MRAFSDLEKQLVRKMVELEDAPGHLNVLGNIIGSFYGATKLPEHCYIELRSKSDVSIQVKKQALDQYGVEWINSIDEDISKKLITIVALFQYLENEKLAYFVGELDLESLGEVWADTEYTRCEFLDDDLKPLVFKYSRKKIFVSETLRLLEANGFKTDEELRHEAEVASMGGQLKYTRLALGVTIIGLIVSSVLPMFVTSSVDINNIEAAIGQQSLEAIENQLHLLNEHNEAMIERLESTILSLQDSVNSAASALSESHNKKMQPTADGGG